ncbi:MAG: peptidoglycan-binding protein [Maritimibacter sp.]|nr:peptidoglycan-binding protein [Maritimibacter sp.]
MKKAFSALYSLVFIVWAGVAAAQGTFIQLEARPDLNSATQAARTYAANLTEVNGFRMASGWYGIALGPYTEEQAIQALAQLRAQGAIPPDSFLTEAAAYTQQFYPVGANALGTQTDTDTPTGTQAQGQTQAEAEAEAEAPEAEQTNEIPLVTEAEPEVVAEPEPEIVAEPEVIEDTETQQQAYQSEAALTREAKMELQRALQWFGFYAGAIDAAIGPGTRRSMAAWQEAEGLPVTGVLTTMQRDRLVGSYQSVLSSLGLGLRMDETAGIEMTMPLAMVEFDRYEPPFAHYESINDSGVRVLLISQTGTESTLLGLYDIMQTLEIVPVEGERNRTANSFTLTGENNRIKSYTYAVLTGGALKGFTLIWPAGEDRRFDVALRAMRDSFRAVPGAVLPDTIGDAALDRSVDLISGLKIRRPTSSRSGFFVDNSGMVLTTTEAVAGCGRISLDEVYTADVVAEDTGLGLALLQPQERLAPLDFARFQSAPVRLQSEIAVSGYSYEGLLSAPTLTYGTFADAQGLNGEPGLNRLALDASAGDAGGPVLDGTGAVVGMLLPAENPEGKRLPEDVTFTAAGTAVAEFLSNNGVSPAASTEIARLSGEDLAAYAAKVTVLVSCWP